MQAWVVVDSNWEYDDNRYNMTDGVHVRKVYTNKEKAKAEVDKCNIEFLRYSDIDYYVDDIDGLMTEEGVRMVLEMVEPFNVQHDTDFEFEDHNIDIEKFCQFISALFKDLSDESVKKFLPHVTLGMCNVQEVELEN